ncbi:MAG: DUF1134 domain-containing protein [Bradyrhizobiaceae bacterium]|nr:DUF1134 domain-containing protein [Bradyrhizobiaceae bacterium]
MSPFRAVLLTVALFLTAALPARAQGPAYASPNPNPNPGSNTYSSNEILDAGHRFFGTVSRDLALLVERAARQWGEPNGYILGQEASGAVTLGLRYGEGVLYTRNAGNRKLYWQGPSIGFDMGGDGARTMMLVYNLYSVDELYRRFGGISGSAYLVGGLGMTALNAGRTVVVPIRSGVGVRLGANIGYLKFTETATWNPF